MNLLSWHGVLLAAVDSPSVLMYFQQANLAGKVIVLFLIVFSLLAWTVMIGKYIDLTRLSDLNRHLETRLDNADSLLRLDPSMRKSARGPYAALIRDALGAYFRAYGKTITQSARISHVENSLQRAVAAATIEYESKMVLLGSIVTGAPFLGLLGTVWGVMDAFGSIALQKSASIQSMAPGVSGALLTTVAGLLVAIPSVFGYNYLLTRTKILITELENFASLLADRFELDARQYEEEKQEEDT